MAKLEFIWQVAALGFLVVLLALFLLYAIINFFSRSLNRFVGSGQREGEKIAPPGSVDRPSARDILPENNGRDPRVMAAITAAVYTFLTDYGIFNPRLTITPAEPSPNTGGKWGQAARKSLLEGRAEIEILRRRRLREKI